MSQLSEWDSFYVIVGSSAGALIGLQFVVMTLIAMRPSAGSGPAIAAFGTPTVVHFSAVLLMAALLRAPWPTATAAALAWGALGVIGIIYMAITMWRMAGQTFYQAEFEDWLFHAALPLLAYFMVSVSAVISGTYFETALFAVAAAALLLLFVAIHNAWDTVAYQVVVKLAPDAAEDESSMGG